MTLFDPRPQLASDDPWRIRVVVLNWNSSELTRRCVRSLLATDYPKELIEVVIVDNGSIDGSVAVLRRLFPTVRILENGENLGFAEGCNRAMRDLEEIDAIALVNNDATVEPDWLTHLVARLQATPGAGAASPKVLFATKFSTVNIDVDGTGDRAELESVMVDGVDVTAKVLDGEGVVHPPHPSIPLKLRREVAERASFHIPTWAENQTVTMTFATERAITATTGQHDEQHGAPADNQVRLTIGLAGAPHERLNNLGTGLTEWNEGVELRFGEADSPSIESSETPGWSGGGVLLRASYLRDIGWFDPKFFAYYEDTDLSWRGRRGGWTTVTEPRSVLHHVHGGTAGNTWPGFFYLNYRNWLRTVLRNGTRAEIQESLRTSWKISWPFIRFNVIGKLRRFQRADWRIAELWARVAASTKWSAPGFIRTRATPKTKRPTVGSARTSKVTSWLQPASAPRPPSPRAGGPLIVYVDVTETLLSGWRAGIQRVVAELTTRLMLANDEIEPVPIIWSPLDGSYRRLDPTETERFFNPPAMKNHPPAPAPQPSILRRTIGPMTRTGLIGEAKDRIRESRARRRRPAAHRDLVIDRFSSGSVFFDPDATWNLIDAPRGVLYPQLAAAGVRIVALQHDLLPITNPEWFDPSLVQVFRDHTDSIISCADLVIANSQHTADELSRYAATTGRTVSVERIDFGSEVVAQQPTPAPEQAGKVDDPMLLCVGTVEPRKNHTALLDAFDSLLDNGHQVSLTIVGRQGWAIDEVADRIRQHPEFGGRLQWPDTVNDEQLDQFYNDAFLVIAPSFSEGFGLPVIEALNHHVPVLCSTGGALREAGGDLVEHFEPTDHAELTKLIERHLLDPEHHASAVERASTYVPRSWDDTTDQLIALLTNVAKNQ